MQKQTSAYPKPASDWNSSLQSRVRHCQMQLANHRKAKPNVRRSAAYRRLPIECFLLADVPTPRDEEGPPPSPPLPIVEAVAYAAF